jgi:hypothetical protein
VIECVCIKTYSLTPQHSYYIIHYSNKNMYSSYSVLILRCCQLWNYHLEMLWIRKRNDGDKRSGAFGIVIPFQNIDIILRLKDWGKEIRNTLICSIQHPCLFLRTSFEILIQWVEDCHGFCQSLNVLLSYETGLALFFLRVRIYDFFFDFTLLRQLYTVINRLRNRLINWSITHPAIEFISRTPKYNKSRLGESLLILVIEQFKNNFNFKVS